MSTNDLTPQPQAAASPSPLRQRLLSEIAEVLPPPPATLPPPPAQTQEHPQSVEENTCHPFSDLNVTNLARQVDSLFLLRWLEGIDSSKKKRPRSRFAPGPSHPNCEAPLTLRDDGRPPLHTTLHTPIHPRTILPS